MSAVVSNNNNSHSRNSSSSSSSSSSASHDAFSSVIMTCDLFKQRLLTCSVTALLLIVLWTTTALAAGRYVSNLNANCLRCLCLASTLCNATIGCTRGYCGPYYLNREYWRDAGRVVLEDDDPERDQAFVDCTEDGACAQKVVENYMAKWGRDCNRDGVTDCDDYARTHFNGKEDCSAIENTNFWRRYETCRPANREKLI